MAQDTTYYDTSGVASLRTTCAYYVIEGVDPAAPERTLTQYCTCDDHVQREERMVEREPGKVVSDGISRGYYKNGTLRWEQEFSRGAKVRTTAYWSGGKIKRQDDYVNDSLVSGKCFTEEGSLATYRPFLVQPEFKGGHEAMNKYLRSKLHYPKKALEEDITGTVYVTFSVDKDGTIMNVRILRSVHPLLDAEALRVVSEMEPWSAGTLDDDPIKCRYNLPIVFIQRGGYH
jgi:TonB family protein